MTAFNITVVDANLSITPACFFLNWYLNLSEIINKQNVVVTGLSILVPAERGRRNGISFTLQSQAVIHPDLHFFRGKARAQKVPFLDDGWNCQNKHLRVKHWLF